MQLFDVDMARQLVATPQVFHLGVRRRVHVCLHNHANAERTVTIDTDHGAIILILATEEMAMARLEVSQLLLSVKNGAPNCWACMFDV